MVDFESVLTDTRALLDRTGHPEYRVAWMKVGIVRWAGMTYYRERIIRYNLAYVLAMDDVAVRNLIIHEVAHACTMSGHDGKWMTKAIELGHTIPVNTKLCGENCLTAIRIRAACRSDRGIKG